MKMSRENNELMERTRTDTWSLDLILDERVWKVEIIGGWGRHVFYLNIYAKWRWTEDVRSTKNLRVIERIASGDCCKKKTTITLYLVVSMNRM